LIVKIDLFDETGKPVGNVGSSIDRQVFPMIDSSDGSPIFDPIRPAHVHQAAFVGGDGDGAHRGKDRTRSSTALDRAPGELASISHSSFCEPTAENEETPRLPRLIDEQFLETPWYGSRQMARHRRGKGWCIGRHRVRRLMLAVGRGLGLYYAAKRGENGGATEPRIYLSQAAILARQAGPPV
jgi:hypothetical protein